MAEPAPRSLHLHDRLAQFILAEVTIVIAGSPAKVGFEDRQSTPVLQFAGCPHCHFALTHPSQSTSRTRPVMRSPPNRAAARLPTLRTSIWMKPSNAKADVKTASTPARIQNAIHFRRGIGDIRIIGRTVNRVNGTFVSVAAPKRRYRIRPGAIRRPSSAAIPQRFPRHSYLGADGT